MRSWAVPEGVRVPQATPLRSPWATGSRSRRRAWRRLGGQGGGGDEGVQGGGLAGGGGAVAGGGPAQAELGGRVAVVPDRGGVGQDERAVVGLLVGQQELAVLSQKS